MFKASQDMNAEKLKECIYGYIDFMKNKLSCREIKAAQKNVEQNGQETKGGKVSLEYPLRQYGRLLQGEKMRKRHMKAFLIEFSYRAPPQANYYISEKIFEDPNVVRHLYYKLTPKDGWYHAGEENELFV